MKRYAKDGPTSSGNAETQLQSFIGKFEPKNQALIHVVRIALRKRLPSANELVYDNYNFFVIGDGTPLRFHRLPMCRLWIVSPFGLPDGML